MNCSRAASMLIRLGIVVGAATASMPASAAERPDLARTLDQLARDGKFSGAIVIRGSEGVRFARGYGHADPFSGRRFTPDTPVDSASLAKPVTAAAVLMLARAGRIDLDAPVRRYLPEYPYEQGTVRQLLSHSAGLPNEQVLKPLAGKSNQMLLAEMAQRRMLPTFVPGTGFAYCNLCYSTLALLIERVSGEPYLKFVRRHVALPVAVTIRPRRLVDWTDRAIGYRRSDQGTIERADSYEDEIFYGSANFSLSAAQLARWGAEWWKPTLLPIRTLATTRASIGGKTSGLTWGNWYCASNGRRCHYLGHHEGFHHMLYWDRVRKISIAMVSNNSHSPALQQRLQRSLVAWVEKRGAAAERELAGPLPDNVVVPGTYKFPTRETVTVLDEGNRMTVNRGGIDYLAFRLSSGIRYVPGLDVYLAGAAGGGLHWLSLYEDMTGAADIGRK